MYELFHSCLLICIANLKAWLALLLQLNSYIEHFTYMYLLELSFAA